MSTKVTVKRTDLIAAIEAKAKANQKAYDEAIKAQPSNAIVTEFNKLLDAIPGVNSYVGTSGLLKSTVSTNFCSYVLTPLGINMTTITAPKLFERELAILKMSTDETLTIDDGSDYFNFLTP